MPTLIEMLQLCSMWFFVFDTKSTERYNFSRSTDYTEISLFIIRNIHKEVLPHEKLNSAIINFNHTEVGWPWNRFPMI